MELQKYLEILLRSKWVIIVTVAVTTLVALAGTLFVTPRYSATATLRLASSPGGASDYIYYYSLTRLSNTFVEMATSDTTLNEIARQLNLPKLPSIQVDLVPETELIKIKATDPNPTLARDIANALADFMVVQSQQLFGSDSPTASDILQGQLKQAKLDLDTALAEYDNALRSAQTTPAPASAGTAQPETNAETLARLLSVRQQIYLDLLQKYETARTSEQLRANALTIVEPAVEPVKPSSPKKMLNLALGVIAGCAAGVILAFVLEGLDDTVRGIDDVKAMTSLPILCMIPSMKQRLIPNPQPTFSGNGHLAQTPSFDQLRARIILRENEHKSTTLLITSPEPGAGKSTVAANLAIALSESGDRVLLIDMDFRRPRVHSIFKLPNETGLSNYLRGEAELKQVMQTTTPPNLKIIVAGPSPHVPSDWFTPKQIGNYLKPLSKEFDYILIDTPAMLSVADPAIMATQAEAVILVVAKRKTQRQNLRYALEQLTELKVNVVGIVMNRMPRSQLYDYYSIPPGKQAPIWQRKIKMPDLKRVHIRRPEPDDEQDSPVNLD